MILLSNGALNLVVDKNAGGSVVSLRYQDRDILRPGPTIIRQDWSPLEYAAFPLLPFSGRIANGRFKANGKLIQLPPNLLPEPHAIHGHGWKLPWDIISKSANSVTLGYSHPASDWPWNYHAEQTLTLNGSALSVDLSLTNTSSEPMPAGLGWHPYFPRSKANISAPTEEIWLSGNDMIPAIPTPVIADCDLRRMTPVSTLNLDNAFQAGGQRSVIELEHDTVELVADTVFRNLIVYVPPNEDFFCVEPVTHAPDAVNSALPASVTGLEWLSEGETLAGKIRLEVVS
jgi:aldose 1-epimerase